MEEMNLTEWDFKIIRNGNTKLLGIEIKNLTEWNCKISRNGL